MILACIRLGTGATIPSGGLRVTKMIRSIANASPPVLAKRKGGHSRNSSKTMPSKSAKARIQEIKAELAGLEDERPAQLEIAPAIEIVKPTGPPISKAEALVLMNENYQGLWDEMKASLSEEKLSAIAQAFLEIELGGYTRNEWRRALQSAAASTGDTTGTLPLQRLLHDKYWKFEHYRANINHEIDRLPAETSMKLHDAFGTLLAEVMERDTQTRWESVILEYVPTNQQKAYQDKQAEIKFRIDFERVSSGRGRSMLPTFPPKGSRMYSLPFNQWTKGTLKVDDIISFSCRSSDGAASFITKRVKAFGGDVVEYQESNMTVPDKTVWVLGDNAKESTDSRYFGAVPLDNIRDIVVATFDTSIDRELVWMRGDKIKEKPR